MTTTNTLIPNYVDMDFNTMKTNLQALLDANPVFKDYNYEGSNITVLIELFSYLSALNTYYLNQIAKNQYISTSDLYETSHMLSELGGYNPMGYRSSSTMLSVSINVSAAIASGVDVTESLIISEWSEIGNSLGITNPTTDRSITFITVSPTTTYTMASVSAGAVNNICTIPITAREGYIGRYDYTGNDITDNKIYLPVNTYDYDDDLEDGSETVKVYVNDEKWTRLSDWFEETETTQTAYMFKYDKYGRYYVEFSTTRDVPKSIDAISIYTIISSGEDGNMAQKIINVPASTFIEIDSGGYLSTSTYTVSNSATSVGGSSPENISEIRNSTIGTLHSQYRSVTKNDYISFLESRADIIQANVWGEQEQSPSGSVQDYNKIYVSLVPSTWDTSTISYIPTSADTTSDVISATGYNATFTADVSEYLKPRKMITTYEEYKVPALLYFIFKIGLKIKANYTFTNVMTDVRAKLEYYFSSFNRTFNETISFIDITEYILDTSITSTTNSFTNLRGLRTLIMRDLDIVTYSPSASNGYESVTIYEPSVGILGNYPYYVETSFTTDNKLRTIQLGHDQFPMLHITTDTFSLEI